MAITQDTDRFSTDAGRFPTSAGRVHINRNTGSFIWEMDVIGTHFPSLSEFAGTYFAEFDLTSIAPNTVSIDYADGTGEHIYEFVPSDGKYRMRLMRRSENQTGGATPANISGTNSYDKTLHFYQDLPLPAGTVDDFYPQHRLVKIKIEKFFSLERFFINRTVMFGQIPSILNRLVSLDSLAILRPLNLTGLDSSLTRVFCTNLTLSNLGFSFGNQVPDFIIKSDNLESINISRMMNLGGETAMSSRMYDLLENPAYIPNLNSFNISQCNIDFQLPNLRRTMTGRLTISVTPSGFKFSPDLSTYHFNLLQNQNSNIEWQEYKRLLEGGNILEMFLLGSTMGQDFDLANDNTTLKNITLGQHSFGGKIPAFLSKTKALERFDWQRSIDGGTRNDLNDWNIAGISDSVKTINIFREEDLPPVLPSWFSSLVNLENLQIDCYNSQTKIDDHVISFYGIAGATTDFDGLNYNLNGGGNNISFRPSGTYQDPGGAPTTPMEMIWKLVNEHNMIVTVLNTAGDGKDIYTP